MLFIEGLVEPLRGWVKSLDPPSFQKAIKNGCNLEASTPRGKFASKPATSSYDRTTPRREEKLEGKCPIAAPLDRETINDLRRRKLFYYRGRYEA